MPKMPHSMPKPSDQAYRSSSSSGTFYGLTVPEHGQQGSDHSQKPHSGILKSVGSDC